LAPCIRPPAYECDFALEIKKTIEVAGVKEYYDSGICTSSDLSKYYSYRIEKGATGRMLALLGIEA
ncbi:MAG: laccase domain-containing protein, partial [Rubritalea sp.]|uniref:laccase domain-containing protein n=1 Tax=Rubritalea sp. TaxID=2109375 RepID=UPI003242C808